MERDNILAYPTLCLLFPHSPVTSPSPNLHLRALPFFCLGWGRPVDSAKEKRVSARKRGTERPPNERAKLGLQAAGGRGREGAEEETGRNWHARRTDASLRPIPPPSSSIPPHSTHSHLPFSTRLSSITSFRRCEHCEGANTRPQNGSSSRLKVRNPRNQLEQQGAEHRSSIGGPSKPSVLFNECKKIHVG